jgi:hypothetical protein
VQPTSIAMGHTSLMRQANSMNTRLSPGRITVLDRAGLEAAARNCYAADQEAYDGTLV